MLITGLEPQKRNKNRVNLYIDGSYYCPLSLETVSKHRIKIGDEIDKDELDKATVDSENSSCFSYGLKYVSRKLCTKKQVSDYLLKKGFLENSVNFALDKLIEYNYINDAEFTRAYVNYSGESKGMLKIKYDLINKGVDRGTVEEEIESIANIQNDVCKKVSEKYMLKKEHDIKTKAALYRYLASKGFTQEAITAAVKDVFSGGDYNE